MLHKIQNCTVAFKLNYEGFTDAQYLAIARNGWNTEYRPQHFHAIVMRMRRTQRTVACLVFRTGRVVMTGVTHPTVAAKEARCAKHRIQHALGQRLGIHNLRVVNIVGSYSSPTHLPIHKLTTSTMRTNIKVFKRVCYDPTIFPALRCKLVGGATCLIYHTGKVIVTGVATEIQLSDAFEKLFTAFLSQ